MEIQKSFEAEEPPISSPGSEAQMEPEEMFREEFIKDLVTFEEGQIVDGTVVGTAVDSIFVDIGYKSEGEIPANEFLEMPAVGKRVKVMIVKKENRDGKLVLSKEKADEIILWDMILHCFKEGTPVEGKIVELIKGGFTVDIQRFKAFLPLSQTAIRKTDDPKNCIGKVWTFKIDKIEGKNKIVLSQRKYLEEERKKKIDRFFRTRKEGDIVEGDVKSIVNYGAFIDLGDIDGLLHSKDIAWGRVQDAKKYVQKGERIKCKILSIDVENKKVSLGLKQLIPDPWDSFEKKYEKGKKYKGTVKKLATFGAFVELEDGIEGLLHVSELSWTKRIKHPKEVLKNGDRVEIMILDYDVNKKLVSLGLKQVLPNPWDDIEKLYPVGSKAKSKILSITKSCIFVELEEGIEGFLSVDDISWTKQARNISEIFKKDEQLEVVILSADCKSKKIQVGLKQLTPNPWESLKLKLSRGSIVTGTVTNVTDFGVFLKVSDEIEGLIHLSHLSNERVENPSANFKAGDEVTAVVLDIDEGRKKVTLSIKNFLQMQEKKEVEKYLEDDTSKTASISLGDLIDLSKIDT